MDEQHEVYARSRLLREASEMRHKAALWRREFEQIVAWPGVGEVMEAGYLAAAEAMERVANGPMLISPQAPQEK